MATRLAEGMEVDATGRGLTVARAEVVWLIHHLGPMRQRDLANLLRVTPRNVTGLVDALEVTGFVLRSQHTEDKRATLVRLTEKGEAVADSLYADQQKFARFLFHDVDGEKLHHLVVTVDKLLHRLRDRTYADIRQNALDRWTARSRIQSPQ